MRMNPASKWSFIQANNPETLAKLVRFYIHHYRHHSFRSLLSTDSLAEPRKQAIFLVLWQMRVGATAFFFEPSPSTLPPFPLFSTHLLFYFWRAPVIQRP